jgi:N-6 DNA Methylase
LYESLVDPDERHDLGEYYTPDWLAGRVVAQVMDAPLTQRVLDPACGSGTFLFHALRRLIDAGRDAGWTELRIVECCAEQVRGWTSIPSRSLSLVSPGCWPWASCSGPDHPG